jgi:hypothetical protein
MCEQLTLLIFIRLLKDDSQVFHESILVVSITTVISRTTSSYSNATRVGVLWEYLLIIIYVRVQESIFLECIVTYARTTNVGTVPKK